MMTIPFAFAPFPFPFLFSSLVNETPPIPQHMNSFSCSSQLFRALIIMPPHCNIHFPFPHHSFTLLLFFIFLISHSFREFCVILFSYFPFQLELLNSSSSSFHAISKPTNTYTLTGTPLLFLTHLYNHKYFSLLFFLYITIIILINCMNNTVLNIVCPPFLPPLLISPTPFPFCSN